MAGSVAQSVTAGMAVFLLLHLAIWRLAPSNHPRIFLLAFLALLGMGVSLLVSVLTGGVNGFALCAVLWIDIFAIIFYMFIYAGIARSVSVTLLCRLLHSGEESLGFKELGREYALSTRFEDRIRLMSESGLVRLSADSVMLTRRGLLLARGAKVLGQVFGDGLRG